MLRTRPLFLSVILESHDSDVTPGLIPQASVLVFFAVYSIIVLNLVFRFYSAGIFINVENILLTILINFKPYLYIYVMTPVVSIKEHEEKQHTFMYQYTIFKG